MKTDIVYSTPWFDLLAKTVDPAEAPYYSLRLPDYAAIVAITTDDRVLAVKQYRPAVDRITVELPSGIIDPGETPGEAAARELIEETAHEAGALEVLGPMFPDTGRLGNRIWACLATGVRPVPGRVPEQGIEVVSYTREELSRAASGGEFDHALHVAVLLMAMLRGKL